MPTAKIKKAFVRMSFLFYLLEHKGVEQGKGSGKREFSRGGSIETARFQKAIRQLAESA